MDITLSSLKSQTVENYEILIADNASTDQSVEVIKKHKETGLPIQYIVNPTNIGFAGNLDKVGALAKAQWMIMLSSDDVVNKNALEVYSKFISLKGNDKNYAFCSTFEKIDSEGKFLEFLSPSQTSIWHKSDIDAELTMQMGFNVYKVKAGEMLKRCLTRFLNPFNFASTCYPKEVYEKVGGYGGGRLYNPDKWFHWKIMAELDDVYYLDNPLFQYRWHDNNQANQQQQNQVLKYWMDEYRNSFEVTSKMLTLSGLTVDMVKANFIRRSILPYVVKYAKINEIFFARRILNFGIASYPEYCRSVECIAIRTLLGVPILRSFIFKFI
jgi:glycosyltransferase involved in cell wall biosynthesis